MFLLTDLKQGDIVVLKDAFRGSVVARIEDFTRDGNLRVRRRFPSGSQWAQHSTVKWGIPLEVSLSQVLRIEVRI